MMLRRVDRWWAGRRSDHQATMIARIVDGLDQSDPRPLVVVFADHAYRDLLHNWLVAVGHLPHVRYLVVALDAPLAAELSEAGVPVARADRGGSIASLWVLRVAVVRALVEAGVDVIHSDADAIWLRDPIDEFFGGRTDADLIVSQGTVFPRFVHARWGFVLCCGLYGIRSSAGARRLVAEWDDHVRTSGDDQVSLNRVLLDADVEWTVDDEYGIDHRDHPIRCSAATIVGRTPSLRIDVLPFASFPRLPEHGLDPYVAHPLIPRRHGSKVDRLRELGLWLADDVERDAPPC